MKPFKASTIAAPIKTTSACTGYPAYFPMLLGIHAPAGTLQLGNPWPPKARAVARPRALALATALTKALALAMAARDGLNDYVPETPLQRRWSARPCSVEGRRKDMVVETICFSHPRIEDHFFITFSPFSESLIFTILWTCRRRPFFYHFFTTWFWVSISDDHFFTICLAFLIPKSDEKVVKKLSPPNCGKTFVKSQFTKMVKSW